MNKLEEKYNILEKYGMHERMDNMIMGKITLEVFLKEMNQKVKEEDLEKEFFEGMSFNNLDMLKGDISELAPIIAERVKVYIKYNKEETVMNTVNRFVRNEQYRKVIYRTCFDLGG